MSTENPNEPKPNRKLDQNEMARHQEKDAGKRKDKENRSSDWDDKDQADRNSKMPGDDEKRS